MFKLWNWTKYNFTQKFVISIMEVWTMKLYPLWDCGQFIDRSPQFGCLPSVSYVKTYVSHMVLLWIVSTSWTFIAIELSRALSHSVGHCESQRPSIKFHDQSIDSKVIRVQSKDSSLSDQIGTPNCVPFWTYNNNYIGSIQSNLIITHVFLVTIHVYKLC